MSYVTQPHTLYIARATGGRTLQQLHGGDTVGNYELQTALRLDQDVWRYVDVPYPGDTLSLDAFAFMDQTSAQGTQNVIDQINANPGRFALAGTSQGAIVMSNVYDEIRNGSLQHRRNDFITGVTFGNPRRESGHTIPGGTDPGGHGILGTRLLSGSESLWWDFANLNPYPDVVTVANDDAYGLGLQRVFQFCFENYTGPATFVADVTNAFNSGFFAGVSVTLTDVVNMAEALLTLFIMGLDLTVMNDPTLNTSGHERYQFPYLGLPGNTTQTAVDLAVQHLNTVGQATPLYVAYVKDHIPTALEELQAGLQSPNPYIAASTAQMAAQKAQHPSTETLVTLYTKFYVPEGEVNDYISMTCEFPRNATETATIVMKHTDPLVDLAMQCYETVVPVTIQIGQMRWSGRVDTFDYALKDGEYTLTLQCQGDYAWFDKIMVWPDFLLPIQAQFPSRALFIGPAITCIKTMIAEQAFRLQSGIWEFVNNALSLNEDWTAWFGTLLESDGNIIDMLMTPIVVVPTNPLFDTSPWVSINGRMDKISTLVEQTVKDNGLVLTANLWLPGDQQPAGLIVPLVNPTIVVDVKDRSGVTGPTGTFIDGVITDVVDLQNSVLGDVLSPFLNPANEYAPEGVNIAPLLGVNFVEPWAIFQDHPRGGLTEFHLNGHHPLAHTVIGGGKSPKWLNDLINATLEFLIDAIEITIGFTGIPDSLFDGSFDDILLAFQEIENGARRTKLGPYGYPEFFQQTGSSAYTLDEWFALQKAMWDTRGYHSIQLSFDNGYPYTVGQDLFVGQLASFALRGKLYTDYIDKVKVTDDRQSRAKIEIMIGDGTAQESGVARLLRKLTGFEEAFQIVTLSSN